MKESAFQAWVIDVAQTHGWKAYHVPTPMRPIGGNKFVPDPRGRGLPDLILLHDDPARLILAEVKNEDGVLSTEQTEFLRLARDVADAARDVARDVQAYLDENGPATQVVPTIGVYVWRPGIEPLIEATLSRKAVA